MLTKKIKSSGFTIVELLIVIIVIAILATLVITAYNGVQTKAKNARTVAATQAWAKAIELYYEDTGNWPVNTCLGDTDTYDGDGACYPTPGWTVKPSVINLLKPYVGSGTLPTPDTTDVSPDDSPRRGARFYYTSGVPTINFAWLGSDPCPKVGGIYGGTKWNYSNGSFCTGTLAP